jgi:hypothetical protein
MEDFGFSANAKNHKQNIKDPWDEKDKSKIVQPEPKMLPVPNLGWFNIMRRWSLGRYMQWEPSVDCKR